LSVVQTYRTNAAGTKPRWINVENYSSLSNWWTLQWLRLFIWVFGEGCWLLEHQSGIDVSAGMVNWGG